MFVGEQLEPEGPDPFTAALSAEAQLVDFDRRLSRFRAESELTALNSDPRAEVPASDLLRDLVRASVWAAERTDGLVDPTLVSALEASGYAGSRDGVAPASLAEALAAAPERRPAAPDPRSAWRLFEVDDDRGVIRRPPGAMLDSGAIGKGLAADLVARPLERFARYVVDVGGDVRVGGGEPATEPVEIEVRHPVTGEAADLFAIDRGAVATSGLDVRLWRLQDGRHAHHLIDPATGEPAWTGLIGASARAPTGLEADVLAKAALLAGPAGARELLAEHGGLVVRDDGRVERFGSSGRHEPVAQY